jgi:hypothetical protein
VVVNALAYGTVYLFIAERQGLLNQVFFPFAYLLSPHGIIEAFFCEQGFMFTMLYHFTLLKHVDFIGMHDGG